ncbi:hypothetical protein EPI10_025850 [Gossypium australe]|uniref:Uncharacterized protein n=1 Tax=Gossypium australe TaxID=47621 RepID=A0A5B6W267_9ROSI|nr:hypothetical protein EPI10_025850 [Gossypium australe]
MSENTRKCLYKLLSLVNKRNQGTQQSLTLSLKGYSGIWICKSLLLGVAVEVERYRVLALCLFIDPIRSRWLCWNQVAFFIYFTSTSYS